MVSYSGKAINDPCPGCNPDLPDFDPKECAPSIVVGSFTFSAIPLEPLVSFTRRQIFGRVQVELDIDQPCPDPCNTCCFAATFLEEELRDGWKKVGLQWPEYYKGQQVGWISEIYASPGETGIFKTQRATRVPTEVNGWDPAYEDKGWTPVRGRRYRTCVQLADAYEGDTEKSPYVCSPIFKPPDFYEVAIDPLWLYLPEYALRINLPNPPPLDVLRATVEEQVAAMTPMERREARERVDKLRTYLEAIEEGLEKAGP